ncbi:hypothetical protein TrVE_jg5227 [Triparma verrucosa]|uniref:Uncharacterized protein n=1 Tax=Triparma verrucosa TaxID=1606542 RepID=A0A9W7AZI9_9STRA|nr:hypothetical protein TrVE_jg5227 [Triparma verrucosa]
MGCASSAPKESYIFRYVGDAPPPGQEAKNSKVVAGSGEEPKPNKAQEPVQQRKSAPAMTNTMDKMRKSSLAGKGSKAKERFKMAKQASAGANAFNKAGKARDKRIKRKNTSPHGWIAKDMHLGPHCSMDKFDVKRVIGTGLMGTVALCKFKKDETWCAVKMVKKDYVCRHNDGRHIHAERKLLNMADNPFICSLFGTFQDKKFIYFVLEYAAGGELFSRLHNRKGVFGAQTSKFYLAEILLALKHVHACGYAYRDLKPENIMLDEEGHCKLIDFGFAAKPDKEGLLHTNVGTPAYLSPEQLNHKKTGGYRMYIDWWAFGCIMFEFMTGATPFCKSFKESSYEIYLKVLKGKINFPGYFDKDAKDLVRQLTTADVDARIKDPEPIKNHQWFSGVDWSRVSNREAVPPHVPRLKETGDCHYFDQYGEIDTTEKEPKKIDPSVFNGF